MTRALLKIGVLALGCCSLVAKAQAPLTLDADFRTDLSAWYVAGVLPLENGKTIASGQMRYQGEILFRALMRFEADGSLDDSFYQSGLGGGSITPWRGDTFYVATSQTVRRILPTGYRDQSFIEMNTSSLFSSLQGGDYHVYPDGSILMSGAHSLYDTVRGFVGIYNLIWFTNTGHLDTTKTHRYCNGVIYEIEQQPDGKFLCSGSCTTYEGQPVRRIFRVHADGALDTSFDSQVVGGSVFEFLPLPDGRVYTAGRISRANAIEDTIQVARFLSNGDLDPTFNALNDFDLGELPTTTNNTTGLPSSISFWPGGQLLVTGGFQLVNGQQRYGICVLDTTGELLSTFDGQGVGTYVYQNFTYGSIRDAVLTPDNMLYVYGAYHGYTDGTTNDPDQRFITRLYGPDLSTAVSDGPAPAQASMLIAPNPAHTWTTVTYALLTEPTNGRILVKDIAGRVLFTERLAGRQGQVVLDTRQLSKGTYTVECTTDAGALKTDRLIVQ
jgi:uncharacterized delta-60 repeat protein